MGLKIILSKSAVIPIQCQDMDLDNILHDFPTSRGRMSCTYLGLPLSLRKLRKVQLQPLIDKIDARLGGYKKKILSRARRLTMPIPIYHMTLTDLPAWTRKQIDKRHMAWFWSGSEAYVGGDAGSTEIRCATQRSLAASESSI